MANSARKNAIGADAAKLAGLQVDLLQKFREGHITVDHLKWFLDLSKNKRDILMNAKEINESLRREDYNLLADLGVITVPPYYNHATRMALFYGRQHKHISDFAKENLFPFGQFMGSRPSYVLSPGEKLWVYAYVLVALPPRFEDGLAFLTSLGAVFPGIEGASLVWEQQRDLLPLNHAYISLNGNENLTFKPIVASIDVCHSGHCCFDATVFSDGLHNEYPSVHNTFLCFLKTSAG